MAAIGPDQEREVLVRDDQGGGQAQRLGERHGSSSGSGGADSWKACTCSGFGTFAYTRRDPCYFPSVPHPWGQAGRPSPRLFHRSRQAQT